MSYQLRTKSLYMMNNVVAVSSVMAAGLLIILGFMGIGYALTSWLTSERGAISQGIGILFLIFDLRSVRVDGL
ncbi:hypothetical protein BVG16_23955 [Paenibacillus selenitireducens]|uniref:Uncharacterized protein n=1 Tax=Paenibacillus selenitireducens TaxID=1324314 RepID=A0A1T2X2V8_9BACL|nr:hypothetical protein [Paenibacillus selenitireducens]OPA74192.1 hypothetical protein BVG16_23955 [Paenibacillus selenitireducens]